MTWRRSVTLTAAAVLLLTACTDKESKEPEGQQFTIVAGGGTNPDATRSTDLNLTGTPKDLEVGRDGIVRLLTTDKKGGHIWLFTPSGGAQRIDLDTSITEVSQLAVADDGTLYVAHTLDGAGLVTRIGSDGKSTRIVGNGKNAFTADGGPAAGPASLIRGVTVDRAGRLLYSETVFYGKQSIGLVRRVEANGRISTIAGRPGALSDEDYSKSIIAAVAPPDGTRALSWPLPGLLQLESLATADDGQILLQASHGVLGVTPDGILHAVARQREAGAAPVGDRPFTREGDAADADPGFLMSTSITADGGYVSMPVGEAIPDRSPAIPPAFGWSGTYTPAQREIISEADELAAKSNLQPVLRLVQPDGSVTTAAWPVDGGAVRGGRVYVLLQGTGQKLMIGSVSLPR